MLAEPTIREAIEFAVKTEALGQAFYEKLAAKFADESEAKEIFTTLAKDEKLHEAQFRELLERAPAGGPTGEQADYLQAMAHAEFFQDADDLDQVVAGINSREDALERALRLERDTLAFYQAVVEVGGASELIQRIIDAEKGHVVTLVRYLMSGAKMRGIRDDYAGGPPPSK
jgi:rubrerythrin